MRIISTLCRQQRLLRKAPGESYAADVAIWHSAIRPNYFGCSVHLLNPDNVHWINLSILGNYVPIQPILQTENLRHRDKVEVKCSLLLPIEVGLLHWELQVGRSYFRRGFSWTTFKMPELKNIETVLRVESRHIQRDGFVHAAPPVYLFKRAWNMKIALHSHLGNTNRSGTRSDAKRGVRRSAAESLWLGVWRLNGYNRITATLHLTFNILTQRLQLHVVFRLAFGDSV